MAFSKSLTQCLAYVAMQNDLIEISDVGKSGIHRIEKSNWPDLNHVPVLNTSNQTFDLIGTVEEIYGHIEKIAQSPKNIPGNKINGGLLLNLFMYLDGCVSRSRTNNKPLTIDYIQFAKEFFPTHTSMYDKSSKFYNREYEENTRRGVQRNELKRRLALLSTALAGKNLGIEYGSSRSVMNF